MRGRGIANKILNRVRRLSASCLNDRVHIPQTAKLGRGVVFETWRKKREEPQIRLGQHVELSDSVRLEAWGGRILVGDRVFLGPMVTIYGHGGVTIGKDTLIAMQTRIISANHSIPPLGTPIRSMPNVCDEVTIGSDVWLGAGVTILPGVSIGDGCVVGANSVVTKSLPPGSIAFGNPAIVKRSR